MLGFPQTTEFNKKIPKQKFYDNIAVSPILKRVFAEQIKLIHWRNKIAPTTVSIAPGQMVNEIEVVEINLNQQSIDEAVLRQIDKKIPYHILFILSCENKVQVWTGYKEATGTGNKAFKVNKYFHTEWLLEDELVLSIEGLNMDAVWENLIIQVGGVKIEGANTLDEQIALEDLKAKLAKDINKLEKQARNEKQPNKKFQLASQVKAMQRQLSKLEIKRKDGTVGDKKIKS